VVTVRESAWAYLRKARRALKSLQATTIRQNRQLLPDLATCNDCREELFNPANRRFEYPFTNCTNCGPRYTIVGRYSVRPAQYYMRDLFYVLRVARNIRIRRIAGFTPSLMRALSVVRNLTAQSKTRPRPCFKANCSSERYWRFQLLGTRAIGMPSPSAAAQTSRGKALRRS